MTTQSEKRGLFAILGGFAGGGLGFLLNGLLLSWIGTGYPIVPTTLIAVASGIYVGMALADRARPNQGHFVVAGASTVAGLLLLSFFLK